jgi:hypothetical protein
MVTLVLLLLVWGGLSLWRRLRRVQRALEQTVENYAALSARIDRLEAQLPQSSAPVSDAARAADAAPDRAAARRAGQSAKPARSAHATPVSDLAPPSGRRARADRSAAAGVSQYAAAKRATTAAAAKAAESARWSGRWQQFEQRVVENWTGIVGAAVLVAGITFLGGYTGLRLPPFYRVLMITAASAALFSGGVVLGRRAAWEALAQWLRSSGAAVFLFACFASSAVPGLIWVTSLAPALGILLLGIGANLAVAFAVRHPGFASLHVVLSLVPLGLAPQSDLMIGIATAVTLAALVIGFRQRWDLHSAITLVAYATYHGVWHQATAVDSAAAQASLPGAASALLVGTVTALAHYRRIHIGRPTVLTLGVHLAGWCVAAAGIAIHAGNTVWRGTALFTLALAVFVVAHVARRLAIRWVYLGDMLAAQAIAAAALIMFTPFVFNELIVPVALLSLAGAYVRIGIVEGEPLLERVGLHATQVSGLLLAAAGLVMADAAGAVPRQNGAVLLAGALIAVMVHVYSRAHGRTRGDEVELTAGRGPGRSSSLSVLAITIALITVVALASLARDVWMETAAFAVVALYLLLARHEIGRSLVFAAWLPLGAAFLISTTRMIGEHPVVPLEQLRGWIPLVLTGVFALVHPGAGVLDRMLRNSAAYLLGLAAGVVTYTLLEPVSSLAPAIVWLTLSLLALEVANRVPRDRVAVALHLGWAYMTCFGVAYVLVVLQSSAWLGPVPARLLIEAYALGVVAFWWLFRPRGALAEYAVWRATQPYLLETALLFLAIAVVVEAPDAWRPLVWALLALLARTRLLGRFDARLRFYSVVFFWASAGDLMVTTSGLVVPASRWFEHPGFTGALAIAAQVAYLAGAARRLELRTVAFPRGLDPIARTAERIGRHPVPWLYYPLFAAVALFLYWRFDAAWWTSLWAAEAFVVFVLSLVLREPHFRYLALAGLGACIVRLLVYDMAQADLGLRGVVFVAVGMLLLAINSLYNRYRARLA